MEPKKPSGRRNSGLARAAALPQEERTAIAKKAAVARWGLRATHKGNFKAEFGIDVECYVLNDKTKTAVISQRGMGLAIGLRGGSGRAFPDFAKSKAIHPYLGGDLFERILNPLIFNGLPLGGTGPDQKTHGYDATILIDVCKAIVQAESDGQLHHQQMHLAKQAHVILSASAKAGITGLVYALAGYDATREEIIAAYKMYVAEEAREYEREFPLELYEQWYRLYGISKPERGRPWEFRYLTIDHIYKPLARSNGKVFALAKSSKLANGEKNDKIHQFLSEIGVKALRTQVGKIAGIALVSGSREEYEKHIAEKIYGQTTFDF
ncbi:MULTISPECIES: P63C domain-containing protein [Burkholderia]|uniref:P63C domain-containing protein n=1 Tax=Burkholderia TaxID=32008 RepID=UPI000F0B807C|nr:MULTISPECIES: P63C domain-containing protein [Burkholderia]AYQ89312.1 hypothetical protein EDD84_19395 [Burkholderia gladioli]MDN7751765.1 P63C domain-containing protein [Burkholderia gladioli]QJW79755.1 hypothetical protein GAS18_14020 [Burkholderia glumae]